MVHEFVECGYFMKVVVDEYVGGVVDLVGLCVEGIVLWVVENRDGVVWVCVDE